MYDRKRKVSAPINVHRHGPNRAAAMLDRSEGTTAKLFRSLMELHAKIRQVTRECDGLIEVSPLTIRPAWKDGQPPDGLPLSIIDGIEVPAPRRAKSISTIIEEDSRPDEDRRARFYPNRLKGGTGR